MSLIAFPNQNMYSGQRFFFFCRAQSSFLCILSISVIRESQVELREHIDNLATGRFGVRIVLFHSFAFVTLVPFMTSVVLRHLFHVLELCRINEHQKVALDLDPYVKKLLNARRRVVLVNNILQNAQVCECMLLFSLFHFGSPHYTFPQYHKGVYIVQTDHQYMAQSQSQPSSSLFTGALATAQPQRCQGNGTQEDHA